MNRLSNEAMNDLLSKATQVHFIDDTDVVDTVSDGVSIAQTMPDGVVFSLSIGHMRNLLKESNKRRVDTSEQATQYLSDYIRALKTALDKDNLNDSATEEWNEEAIETLASYYYNNDYAIYDLSSLEGVYKIYDVLKWTNSIKN